jgi:hypothetical protein
MNGIHTHERCGDGLVNELICFGWLGLALAVVGRE